ncbi:MAG: TIGR01777 family oxidoreductase [Polyangiaceae bacterium]|jgi:uncharacterized protein (TIGR01777 family)
MRILVTGGTGFIGRALVRSLTERGDQIVIVSRRAGPHTISWDEVETHAKQVDAIVHLAGESLTDGRWTPERLARKGASRMDTTALVARAVAAASHRPRVLVSASAVGIYGQYGADAPSVDESALPGDDVLARLCVDWEAAADPARQAGVRVVHPRFGIVLGAGGGMLAKLAPVFRWFAGGPIGRGAQWVSWVHVRDAVCALLFALDRDDLAGAVNVVAPVAVTMNEFARALGRALKRPSLLRVPALALRVALGEGLAQVLLTGQHALPRRLEEARFTFAFPTIDAALEQLATELLRS